jgi:hypothetical protein
MGKVTGCLVYLSIRICNCYVAHRRRSVTMAAWIADVIETLFRWKFPRKIIDVSVHIGPPRSRARLTQVAALF